MEVLYIVLPLAVLVAAAFVGAFVWATRRGQFDDMETPALRMLMDDEPKVPGADSDASKSGER